MYYFDAVYEDYRTGEERTKRIMFDGQFLESEKECFVHAMRLAYDAQGTYELLVSLHFIAC